MPRIARTVAVGHPHHVTQRGNYRQSVFDGDDDFKLYLSWLKEYSGRYGLKIWAYCLMQNHVHFICVPTREKSLSSVFNALHTRYSQYYNKKKKITGHLWQGRFYSCALDDGHLFAGIRYVENNPLRAGVVKRAEDYKWSSAKGHINNGSDPVLSTDCYLTDDIKDWKKYLREKDDTALTQEIRKNSKTGRPCGDDGFVRRLERLLDRRLKALPHGRPRKGAGKQE